MTLFLLYPTTAMTDRAMIVVSDAYHIPYLFDSGPYLSDHHTG